MSRRDQLLPILAQLDGHVADDDCSSVDADRWRAEKHHIARMKDALDLARIELERMAPERGQGAQSHSVGLGVEK